MASVFPLEKWTTVQSWLPPRVTVRLQETVEWGEAVYYQIIYWLAKKFVKVFGIASYGKT